MNFYLSSYKVGDKADELKKWINQHRNMKKLHACSHHFNIVNQLDKEKQ